MVLQQFASGCEFVGCATWLLVVFLCIPFAQDKRICTKCWPLMSCAVQVLNHILKGPALATTLCLCSPAYLMIQNTIP